MLEQAADFRAESDVLYDLLAPLSEDEFKRPTLFKEWTTNDILAHLHWGNMQADLSLNNEAKFLERFEAMKKLRETGAGMRVICVHGSSHLALCGGILRGLSSAE